MYLIDVESCSGCRLHELNLSGTSIEALPSALSCLGALTEILVSCNFKVGHQAAAVCHACESDHFSVQSTHLFVVSIDT